jgi:hypothetical protein
VNMTNMSGDSSVSIVIGYRFDARILIPKRAGQYWGPPSLVSFGCRGVEQRTRLTTSRVDVRNVGNYTPLPHTSGN